MKANPTIDSTEEYFREMERRINWHVWEAERIAARTPAEVEAWKIIDDLCSDPGVWATHGIPGDAKLERIAKRIAATIAPLLVRGHDG